jgi:hypothetical protein
MIHHVSIAVREPERVATVLAELLGGFAGPFLGPIPGAWVAFAADEHGTGIEVYPERTALAPGGGMRWRRWSSARRRRMCRSMPCCR